MESGPSSHSRATSRSRVSSPSAAKIGAAPDTPARAALARRDMALEVLDLLGPTTFVHPEGLGAAVLREPVESGLDDRESCPLPNGFQAKLDEGGRLRGV